MREILEQRLLANRLIDENDCWLWTKSCQAKGYGQTSLPQRNRSNRRVHRVAAWLWLGFDLDSPLCVLHRCDVPRCFNPDHLFIGTPADNTADMIRKGRYRCKPLRGEASGRAKLTEDDVREIRRIVQETGAPYGTYRALARRFDVTDTLIWRIAHRKCWRHI